MSRLRIRKKNKCILRTTMVSLILSLIIGIMPNMATYALFKDSQSFDKDFSISTGDIDVRVDGGFNIEWNEDDDDKSYEIPEFKIYNDGTLSQNIRLSLSTNVDVSKYITYDLKFAKYNNREIKSVNLSKNNIELRYKDNDELVKLNSNDYITVRGSITINEDIEDLIEDGDTMQIVVSLNVSASQINNIDKIEEKGFYDKEVQKNYIQISDDEDNDNIISEEAIKTSGYGSNSENANVTIFIDLIKNTIDVNKLSNISILGNTGKKAFLNAKDFNMNKNHYVMSSVDLTQITKNFGDGNIIQLVFEYKDNKPSKIYEFDFRSLGVDAHGNLTLQARFKEVVSLEVDVEEPKEEISNEPDKMEPSIEEVVVPNEQDEVEPPEEEAIVPDESEIDEPSKEEIIVPIQPDIMAPSKENIEIQ